MIDFNEMHLYVIFIETGTGKMQQRNGTLTNGRKLFRVSGNGTMIFRINNGSMNGSMYTF